MGYNGKLNILKFYYVCLTGCVLLWGFSTWSADFFIVYFHKENKNWPKLSETKINNFIYLNIYVHKIVVYINIHT